MTVIDFASARKSAARARAGVCDGRGRVALVFNPQSGQFSASALAALSSAFEAAGLRVSRHDSLGFDCAREGPFQIICVAGGDGTLRDVMSANADVGAARWCVFPAGTINLIAREADYPAEVAAFVRRVLAAAADAAPRWHYGARAGAGVFLACASVGPDAAVVGRVSLALKRRIGRLAYVVALAAQLWAWPRHRIELTADGERLAGEAVFVAKGHFYAGPWSLSPEAGLAGKDLHILLMPRARRRDFTRLVLAAMSGWRWFADPAWQRRRVRRLRIGGTLGLPVQADGDIIGATPIEIAAAHLPQPFL